MNETKAMILSLEDEQIAITASQKDPKDFRILYETYFGDVFRFIYYRVGSKDIANDLSSNVFYNALLKIKKFKFTGVSIKAWFFKIALNEVLMHFRSTGKSRVIYLTEESVKNISEESDYSYAEKTPMLMKALDDLKDDEVELIEMKYFEKLSHREISDILNITEANAKVKLHRSLKKLKDAVTKQEKK